MLKRLFPTALFPLLLLSLASFGAMTVLQEGTWPDTWPKELEPYRPRALTLGLHAGHQEDIYVIPFQNREEFEAAWPHLLKVRSPKSPVTLERSPWKFVDNWVAAGVRVLHPRITHTPNFTTPNWPKDIEMQSGEFPEYVVQHLGKWVPPTGDFLRDGFAYRARVDIVLVVDDNIVNLARITLPEDAKVIDKRKEEKKAGDSTIRKTVP